MFDCSTRIRFQSQTTLGFFIFHSDHVFNLSTKSTNTLLLFNTTQPCLRLHPNCRRPLTFLLQSLSSSSSTTNSQTQNPLSSADYLVTSLALSSKSALGISKHKHIDLKSTSNADSVLALFSDYGFSQTHLATIFSVCPVLLSYDPLKNLKPKLDFFAQNGISGDALVRVLLNDPTVLKRSLQKVIIPCFNFFNTFFGDDNAQAVLSLFSAKRGTWVLRSFSSTTAPNVEALRSHGVPDPNIVRLLFLGARTLSRDTDEFVEILREVSDMGFDPLSKMFIYGLRAFTMMKKEKWVSKLELLKKTFGWTEKEVKALIVKEPNFMTLSEERLKEGLELFMNRLEWTPEDIAKYPTLLSFNVDQRIVPRLSVVEILMSKGIEKKTCMGYAFKVSEGVFLSRFVEKYKEEIPNLLQVYEEKMGSCKS